MGTIGQRERLALWLHYAAKASPRQFQTLRKQFSSLEEAFRLAEKRSLGAFSGVGDGVKARMYEAATQGFLERYTAWLDRHGIAVLIPESEDYPALLREIHDPPQVLFVKGKLPANPALPIAMVGARRSTKYGRDIAQLFAQGLAESGATIISGLARGIDSAAARGALLCKSAACPTVAVLGTGIDVVYPKENAALYAEIAERGAVVTEFLPKTTPSRENFPIRNRIMSGLSRGVVVVEAGERSGTSITAGFAHDQGREVFAVPGRITDRQSVGTNRLIQRGEAKPVFCVDDILQEFSFAAGYDDGFFSSRKPVRLSSLPEAQQAICRALFEGEANADEIAERTGLATGLLNSSLTALLFSGIMKQLPGRVYALDSLNTELLDE